MENNDLLNEMLDELDKWSQDKSYPISTATRECIDRAIDKIAEDPDRMDHRIADPHPDFGDAAELTPEQEAELDAWHDRQEIYAHEVFIDQMVLHGNRRLAYQKAYPNAKDKTARTGAWRLLKDPKIANSIRKKMLDIKQQEIEVLKEQYNKRLADIEEKREILAQIIRGELVAQREVTKNGETQIIKYASDPKERIRAIIIDNRMEEEWRKAIALPDEGVKHLERA